MSAEAAASLRAGPDRHGGSFDRQIASSFPAVAGAAMQISKATPLLRIHCDSDSAAETEDAHRRRRAKRRHQSPGEGERLPDASVQSGQRILAKHSELELR